MSYNIKQIYRDICRGYSEVSWSGPVFVRHLDTIEMNEVLNKIEDYKNHAIVNLGLKTEDQLTKELIESGDWPVLKERSIKSCDEDIENLELSKKSINNEGQINDIYDAIEEYKEKKRSLLTEKYSMIKMSAELYAHKLGREYMAEISCYRDRGFTQPIGSLEYENTEHLLNSLLSIDVSSDKLKEIAIQPFFFSLFTLSEDIYNFFGKPLYSLTYNQVNLLRCAKTYAQIAYETSDVPDKYASVPDKLIMWHILKKNSGTTEESAKQKGDELETKLKQTLSQFGSR
jgi:hypothetical protein